MNLAGNYLLVWLEESAARYFLGQPASGVTKGYWIVAGKAAGETPGVGIWLDMTILYTPDGDMISPSVSDKPTYLLRWDWIKTVRVYKTGASGFPVGKLKG